MKQHHDTRNLRLTLILYLIIFLIKLGVYLVSGVMALMAEALHTLSDIFISGFLLLATNYSRRPADKVHMFGYGRAQNVAALVAATLFVSFTSLELYREAIPRLFEREPPHYQNVPLALGVLVFSMAVAAVPLFKLMREGRSGAAAKAQFLELINDQLGLLAALVGTLFVLWGVPIADPIASIAVATIIVVNAVGLFRENLSFLLGRAPPAAFLQKIRRAALSVPGVMGAHDLRAEYIGPDVVHADIHIVVDSSMTVAEADAIAEKVDLTLEPLLGDGICEVHIDVASREPARVS